MQPGSDRPRCAAHILQHKSDRFQCAVRTRRKGLGGVKRCGAVPKGKGARSGARVGIEPFRMRVMPPNQGLEPSRTAQPHFRGAGLAADTDDPWRGNPLQIMAWLTQDEGDLPTSEKLLREVLSLHERGSDTDILIAGTLADLGEVVGLQRRFIEAIEYF